RAYRVVLLDAGHLCQTFCLTATRIGLAPFSTAALKDTLIEQDLGIDGISESVLYVAGVGLPAPIGRRSTPPRSETEHPVSGDDAVDLIASESEAGPKVWVAGGLAENVRIGSAGTPGAGRPSIRRGPPKENGIS
ncbi:MAG TPA: nitroreductase family protein, partial [Burkholderiaceae bacterium]|nr:nitroreductase family protein [Burkholderiaceae bacterium]